MKNTIKLIGIIALVTVIGFSMTACGDDDNGGGSGGGGGNPDTSPIFTSIDALGTYLSEQEENTAATPYKVRLNVSDLDGISTMLKANSNKYVSLDLSGSTLTSIGYQAFMDCTSLVGIIIPNSVTSIEQSAFYQCTSLTSVTIPASVTSTGQAVFADCISLTSVTFQGTITYFGTYAFYNVGDLQDKYAAGGIGTYTRPNTTSTTWTKQ